MSESAPSAQGHERLGRQVGLGLFSLVVGILAVAVEAVVAQNRPHIAIELDFGRNGRFGGKGGHRSQANKKTEGFGHKIGPIKYGVPPCDIPT